MADLMRMNRRQGLRGLAALGLGLGADQAWAARAGAAGKPALFLIGDSTIRNGYNDNGETAGQFGWGHMMKYHFDTRRIDVVNDAMGGTSSRSYLVSPTLWGLVEPMLRPGDYVLVAFGHNDSGASARGNGDEIVPRPPAPQRPPGATPLPPVPQGEMMHSFGWYMRQYIKLIRARGAHPIVLSLIPRNRWRDGKVIRNDADYALWASQAAEQEKAPFIPLNTIIADRYDALGQDKVTADFFPPKEVVHPNWTGAAFNAACTVEGLKALKSPLAGFLVSAPRVPLTPDVVPPAKGELGPSAREPRSRRPS